MTTKITTFEVEKVFNDDVREKKISSRGVHNRALRKKGFRGGVRFPSDSLKPSQIKRLNGEVRVYNMYDNVPPYAEFKKMSDNERVTAMSHWINDLHLTKDQILEGWGFVGKNHLHYYFDNVRRLESMGLVVVDKKDNRKKSNNPAKTKANKLDKQARKEKVVQYEVLGQPVKTVVEEPKKSATVFNISWNDSVGMTGEDVSARLVDIGSIINKNKKYVITVEIGELRE